VPKLRETSPARDLLAEVNNPRLSLIDDSHTRERESDIGGRIAEYAIISLVVLVIAGLEVARWVFKAPPQPLLFGFVAAGITLYAGVRIALLWRNLLALRRGQQSRQNLRAAIDEICSRGWLLFDGLTDGRGHLLGSVLAGPGGLFTIIPRFIARGGSASERVRLRSDGTLHIGDHTILADPTGHAQRAAHSLYEVLAAAGLETIAVQPVVVIPGWTVAPPEEGAADDVWVLSDTDLVPRLTQSPTVLEARDLIGVSMLLEQLGRG
jgi:hypothetical protein